MRGLGLGHGLSRTSRVTGTLSILTVPTLGGDPVVGQTILATSGTYSAAPDSFTRTWTLDGVVLDGQTDDALLINDIYAGGVIGYSEVAHKGGHTDSAANPAVSTAAVALIDLTNAITSFDRTSVSGVTPMTWSIVFASNVRAGYMTRWEVAADTIFTQTALLQDVHYRLTNDDLQPSANLQAVLAAAGLTAPAATNYLRVTVYTTSPNGLGYLFTTPIPISPTDAVISMTYSASDKDANVTLSGGNLTAGWFGGGGGSNYAGVRTNRGLSADGKYYWEELVSGASARTRCAIADLSGPLGGTWTPESADVGFGSEPHAAAYYKDGTLEFNGAHTTYTGFADGAVVRHCLKISGATKTYWIGLAGGWLNGDPSAETTGLNVSSMSLPIHPAAQFSFGGSLTGRFASTDWTLSAPTGAVQP